MPLLFTTHDPIACFVPRCQTKKSHVVVYSVTIPNGFDKGDSVIRVDAADNTLKLADLSQRVSRVVSTALTYGTIVGYVCP